MLKFNLIDILEAKKSLIMLKLNLIDILKGKVFNNARIKPLWYFRRKAFEMLGLNLIDILEAKHRREKAEDERGRGQGGGAPAAFQRPGQQKGILHRLQGLGTAFTCVKGWNIR